METDEKSTLLQMYAEQKMSIPDIAKLLCMNYSAARKKLLDAGIELRSRADGVRNAASKISAKLKGRKLEFTDEWRRNMSLAKQAYANTHAVGVSLKPSGYFEFTRGENKGRSVHVVTAEAIIGRRLRAGEQVHHKDGNKQNNNPENLQVMTISEHMRLHALANAPKRERSNNGRFC